MYHVYLAGPILALTFEGAQDWRNEAFHKLDPYGIKALSPMRGRADYYYELPILYPFVTDSPERLTQRDRWDCQRADVVLFNFIGAQKISFGSVVELGWADAARRPIVVCMEKEGNPHEHVMLQTIAGFRVDNLSDGIEVVKGLLIG
jgi:nucleoside 2-deoxyribosyltransferase